MTSIRDPWRPREYDRVAILAEFEKYIAETDIPIVAEFAARHGMHKTTMKDWGDEAEMLIARCISKKEAGLERLGLDGSVNTTMAVFSLKQLGWTDKQDVKHSGDAAHPVVISPTAGKW